MKIDQSINSVTGANGVNVAETRSRTAGKTGAAPDAAAVRLSESAQQIQSKAGSGPVADPERIAEIRQAIADGSFSINSNAIADRIITTARALIASR